MLKVLRKLDNDGWFIYGSLPAEKPTPAGWEWFTSATTQAEAQRLAADDHRSCEDMASLTDDGCDMFGIRH